MEHYLKALQCDVQQINNIMGLHMVQFILVARGDNYEIVV